MSRMIVAVCMAVTLCLVFVTGCAKKSQPPAKPQEQTKTAAEYKAEADKEIKQENANQELDNLEKSIAEESAQEQQ
jgi:outer membrane lipoprotein-sorting protein